MNREDVIRMAREVEIEPNSYQGWLGIEQLERFAALVAAAEREACAKVCEDDQSQAGEWTAESHVGGYFAARIRARGNT